MEWDTCGRQSVSDTTIIGVSLELVSGGFSPLAEPLVVNSSESLEVLGDGESLSDISGSEVDEILLFLRPSGGKQIDNDYLHNVNQLFLNEKQSNQAGQSK